MRKIIVTEFISLDGVIERPAWTVEFGSPEQEKYKLDELMACDALLLGRVTYEGFSQAWPSAKDAVGFADRMNSLPKYVVSTTLKEARWNNSTIIRDNVPEQLQMLKRQPGKDILVGGSGRLVETLKRHDLVDEYRLMVFPIVLGTGQRLFPEGTAKLPLKRIGVTTFASGVSVLGYRPR